MHTSSTPYWEVAESRKDVDAIVAGATIYIEAVVFTVVTVVLSPKKHTEKKSMGKMLKGIKSFANTGESKGACKDKGLIFYSVSY